ncbi:MAG TPA: alanine dehydrogenase [Candidatus Nesterenkonia stercoripullorum]|uniref:Alanine dehydrogenase n=1 Tax=Candidatus Nesterenkonia stercoripullorum TaxID=2838701 RepID=A0A9D1S3S6_9MICC|nr:alanine dehydrogenase [Candidatus Nesterenkonia stercoripullorum]
MRVGIPAEVKNNEHRVAMTPAGVYELSSQGHDVFVQAGAGQGSTISDEEFRSAGAAVIDTADALWAESELVLKVKEPLPEEYHRLRPGLGLFTYLHLAASESCTRALLDAEVDSIAYEMVTAPDGSLPLLFPMSEVAGRLAPLMGLQQMFRTNGGTGALIGGVSGVKPARVVIIGAGVSGMNAVDVATSLWADVVLLDKDISKLRAADRMYQGRIRTVASSKYSLEEEVAQADLVIGAVLIPGARAPKLVTNEMVRQMRPGAVLVDIAIDQGGCFEDSRPTTHDDATFRVHDATFYCVANMPGAVPRTSTFALSNVTTPYAAQVANLGLREAARSNPGLQAGLSTLGGQLTSPPVGRDLGIEAVTPTQALDMRSAAAV